MSENHSLCFDNGVITVKGVVKIVEITQQEAQLKLSNNTLLIKGVGLSITKLDKEQGVVAMEVQSITSIVYKQGALSVKGLFK